MPILTNLANNLGNQNQEIRVYAFIGPSGTGKSYRAQMVASENHVSYIIDDGILIRENNIIAGNSAKKAPTKVETVRKAVFLDEKERNEMKKAIKKCKPESILILGTSDGMVDKIAENLGLPKPEKRIYINEVATETEMETAKRIRTTQGKHVIPVPTFEIKKDFSGFILDPLQIFKFKGKGNDPYISEKSIIRPTFSYLGNFTISDTVFRQIAEYLATRSDAIYKVMRNRVESTPEGPNIYMEVSINYGCNILESLREFKEKIKKEIEKLTTMTVKDITIVAKGIHMPETETKQEEQNEVKKRAEVEKQKMPEKAEDNEQKDQKKVDKSFVVAIDGPAGTGKGTITKLIAQELNLVNIDTGATYRCVTLKALQNGVTLEEKEKLIEISKTIKIDIENKDGVQKFYLDGKDVTEEIRSKEVTAIVSQVSSIPEVRENMVAIQRKMAEGKNVIMEGRDITTVVFPNADVKIYLDADVEERAKRRYEENLAKGMQVTFEETLESVKKRDYNDMHKPVGALKIAKDATVVDTTKMTIEEVKEKVKEIILDAKNM